MFEKETISTVAGIHVLWYVEKKKKKSLHLNSVFNLSTLGSYIFFPSTQSI